MKEKNKTNFLRIVIFIFCYLVYEVILSIPGVYQNFNFFNSNWNWVGKIFGIGWGIICYFLFKKYFIQNNFFTITQNKINFKKALIAAISIVILNTIFRFGKSEFDFETLAFQISVPGIDEEIMYRGILLGLLLTSLKDRISRLGNPAILLTSILFGLVHGLKMGSDFGVHFDIFYFLQTEFSGYIWVWITVKSRSILQAILSHNFSNFFGILFTMIK